MITDQIGLHSVLLTLYNLPIMHCIDCVSHMANPTCHLYIVFSWYSALIEVVLDESQMSVRPDCN